MKVLGIELDDWEKYGLGFTRQHIIKELPYEFVDIQPSKHIFFGHKLKPLEFIFYQQYKHNYIEQLSFDEIKQLIDQFLEQINNFGSFV